MRTYLVVAHRTLIGQHLLDHVRALVEREQCRFHLVVPVYHPSDHGWSDGEVTAAARQRLDEGLRAFRAMGVDATGEVGDANPVYAASVALRGLDYSCDEIILSTLPPGVSRWLGLDAVSRMRREFDLPLTHLVADRSKAET